MAVFFYLFASLAVLGSILVIHSKNPVYSVLSLIFTFCNAAGLLTLLKAEFLAMMLIIVYVGAVAVLFLFIVMMLDVSLSRLREVLRQNIIVGSIIASVMLAEMVVIILLGAQPRNFELNLLTRNINEANVQTIGKMLYTDFILVFQSAGLVLFVAMIACIHLTLQNKRKSKRQDINQQLQASKDGCLSLTKPNLNSGISDIKYE